MDGVFAPPKINVERRGDGSIVLASADPLTAPDPGLAAALRRCAAGAPGAVFATEPAAEGRRTLTYRQAREGADALGEALLAHGLSAARPLAVLSGNSLPHLLLTLAAYTVGVPIVPLSPALSLLDGGHRKLRGIIGEVAPGMVYAEDGEAFGPALDAVADLVPSVVTARGHRPGDIAFDTLLATEPTDRVERACAGIGPDTVAKILFTSGSTGDSKGVPNTHGMLCAGVRMMAQVWPFLATTKLVLVDWLPWSHTFGGNHNLHLVMATGGTLHIDDGGPTPELFERSVRNLEDASPNVYFNVPAGFQKLVEVLEARPEFARRFFGDLRLLLNAGAPIAEPLRRRMLAVARRSAGHEVRFTSSWGMTETSAGATTAHFDTGEPGAIGVPLPGLTLKLAPVDGRYEIRVKGPNVLPGYFGRPDLDAVSFDVDGYFRTGDAAKLADPDDPGRGLLFDGRLSEDFKLATGTWVRVTPLRDALLSAAGVLADAVVLGEGRDAVTALGWLAPGREPAECRERIAKALAEINAGAGSSRRVARLLVLADPPSREAGERSDKGTINQRRVLARRPEAVERLYREPPGPDVIEA